MNDLKLNRILSIIDWREVTTPQEDLVIALALLKRNPKLMEDYPRMESMVNQLESLIEESITYK